MNFGMEHVELAQGCRSGLPGAKFSDDGCIQHLDCQPMDESSAAEVIEFDRSNFMRVCSESFPINLEGLHLRFLGNLCLSAYHSEEFFASFSKNQWLRTAIKSDLAPANLFSPTTTAENYVFHSNVLPCGPYWTKLQASCDGSDLANKRLHFPCSILTEALREGKTLMAKLDEWWVIGEECVIGQHGLETVEERSTDQPRASKLFREIRNDAKIVKMLVEDSGVSLVTWRRGVFIRKVRPRTLSNAELIVMEKLSHPHIVHCFGVSFDNSESSVFMECMQNELFLFILDKVREMGDDRPPFSHEVSVDILLQVAKAMEHVHKENVVHCDLKSQNILISEFVISEEVKYYLVKVADFDESQSLTSQTDFTPGGGTTNYAAPEVLLKRRDKHRPISCPHKIDVYSFGIVAFEVLTGRSLYEGILVGNVKKGVIDGTLRPPLRAACKKPNFFHDEKLMSLIESCWHKDASKRPSFANISDELDSVRSQFLVPNRDLSGSHTTLKPTGNTQSTQWWPWKKEPTTLETVTVDLKKILRASIHVLKICLQVYACSGLEASVYLLVSLSCCIARQSQQEEVCE